MVVGWAELKAFADARGLSIQYVDLGVKYALAAFDGIFALHCEINKSSDDAADFDANYKANGNKPVKQRSYNNLGEDDRFSFFGKAFSFTAIKNISTTYDFLLDQAYALKGGSFYSEDSIPGDYIKCQIVDVDNVLGYGAGFVVAEYIDKWYVYALQQIHINNEFVGVMPVSGLYFRVVYTSDASATVDSTVFFNLFTYKVK